jgi:serine protease Do
MRHRFWSVMPSGLALAAGLLLLAPLPALLLLAPLPATAQQMQMMPPSQSELIRGLLPAVVNISSFVTASDTASMNAASGSGNPDQSRPKRVQGSGFIIDQSGVILTNYHVIDGAYDIRVMFSDGMSVPGRILATAARIDLALVKVDAPHALTVVQWADSDRVQIGDSVFAIGNPLGIGLSVSSGIVSALNRNIMDTPYDDFIQTDAAINHGNSGGPLFNRSGEVIGVDTAIVSPSSGSAGLGFAIPANDAKFIAGRLLRDGSVRPAYLGLKLEEVTDDIATALGMPQPKGSIIAVVHPDGPAATAGMQVGDVILRYDNQTQSDERALLRSMAKTPIGQTVPAVILRAGQEQTVQVTPVAWPDMEAGSGTAGGTTSKPVMLVPANLGLSLSVLDSSLRAKYGLQMQQAGVVVGGVAAGTDAFDRGLAPGDVILRVQGTEVSSPEDVQAAIAAARAQHKPFILALVLPKTPESPGPRWMALRVS